MVLQARFSYGEQNRFVTGFDQVIARDQQMSRIYKTPSKSLQFSEIYGFPDICKFERLKRSVNFKISILIRVESAIN